MRFNKKQLKSGIIVSIFLLMGFSSKAQGISITQVYSPTDETSVSILGGSNNVAPYIQSNIWTVQGTPTISRWYMNFDLSDFFKTKNTRIEHAVLYLYHSTPDVCFNQGSASDCKDYRKCQNLHNIHLVTSAWHSSSITWDEQPIVDENIWLTTRHVSGTMQNPDYSTNYEIQLNDLILKNGLLRRDFNGITSSCFPENLHGYYRRWLISTTRSTDKTLHPKLKVEYTFLFPKINFTNNVFSVIDHEDLKTLFKNVRYLWIINEENYEGERVNVAVTTEYNVRLQIKVTNNIGEVFCFDMTALEEGQNGIKF